MTIGTAYIWFINFKFKRPTIAALPCPKPVCPGIERPCLFQRRCLPDQRHISTQHLWRGARSFPILIKWKIVCAAAVLLATWWRMHFSWTTETRAFTFSAQVRATFWGSILVVVGKCTHAGEFSQSGGNCMGDSDLAGRMVFIFFLVGRFLLGCLVLECLAVIRTCVELEILAYLFLARHSYSPASLGITEWMMSSDRFLRRRSEKTRRKCIITTRQEENL